MEQKVNSKKDLQKEFRFVLSKAPNLKGDEFNPTEFIPGECEVYDPNTQKTRTAIYLPGMTSIWVDEIESLKNKDRIIGKKILFVNGWKVVSYKESNLLKFLRVSGNNEATDETRVNSSVLYKEWKTEELAEKKFIANKEIDNAIYFVNNGDIREVRAYALALASNNKEWKQIQDASEFEIRIALRPLAERNPEKFTEALQDVSLRNKVKIIQAIYSDIIILNEQDKTLAWKNGDIFVKAPIGMDVVKYFADMSVDSPKFKEAYDSMLNTMKGVEQKNKKVEEFVFEEKITEEKEDEIKVEVGNAMETLLDRALELGVITGGKNNIWYVYEGKKFKTRKLIIDELKNNSKLSVEIYNLTK